MNPACPHVSKQVTLSFETDKNYKNNCDICHHAGPNLWICMQLNCQQVGCSEQANDHSTQHFKLNNAHCVHLNLSSRRIWCYICEKEVFLEYERTNFTFECFELTDTNNSNPTSESNDFKNMRGLVGLQNIANTCYMNSALQALSNIHPLTYYFLDCAELIEHTLDLRTCRNKSKLAKSYLRLMKDIWCSKNKAKDFIAPRGILCGIRNVHPIFRGFQQHDTQEFLRCFMDQLHEELKEQKPKMSKAGYKNSMSQVGLYNSNIHHQPNSETVDVELCLNSQSDSTSHSEAEYETCDSGVSESSLFDDMCIHKGNTPGVHQFLHEHTNLVMFRRKSKELVPIPVINADHSIITDVFDGKLLSSVQCLTCDRVSTREETFQDLSLPIPNRDSLNVLHQAHIVQSIHQFGYGLRTSAPANSELIKSDDWLTWIWKVVRSWFWGPSVTLHDCMASFFSADELKGDNMYSCEKCNKLRTGVKFSRIIDLPEILCIHLKRFRHDLSYSSKISSYINFPIECFDMSPYLHKDCKSSVSVYNLVSVICHYGTVGGGHYTCFAKNEFTRKWYEFDDQNVTEVSVDTVKNCQAYVLFYRKRNQYMDLIRADVRDISNSNPSHGSDIRFYVSREWLTRFNTFAEPGPINNWAILCSHGGLPPSKIDVINKIAIPITQQLWDYLYKKFGGGPAINVLFECELCKREEVILTRRQNYELTMFTKYNDLENSNAIFAISMPWLRKWQFFARGCTKKEPGPITNSSISASIDSSLTPPIRNVITGSDYAQIKEPLWKFLYSIYGGGPEIKLREIKGELTVNDKDYYDNYSEKSKSNFDLLPKEAIKLSNTNQFEKYKSTEIGNFGCANINKDIKVQDITTKALKKDSKHSRNGLNINKKTNILFDHNASKSRRKRKRSFLKNAEFFRSNDLKIRFNKGSYNSNLNDTIIKMKFREKENVLNNKSDLSFQCDIIGDCDENLSNVNTLEQMDHRSANRAYRKGYRNFIKRNKLKANIYNLATISNK